MRISVTLRSITLGSSCTWHVTVSISVSVTPLVRRLVCWTYLILGFWSLCVKYVQLFKALWQYYCHPALGLFLVQPLNMSSKDAYDWYMEINPTHTCHMVFAAIARRICSSVGPPPIDLLALEMKNGAHFFCFLNFGLSFFPLVLGFEFELNFLCQDLYDFHIPLFGQRPKRADVL